MDAETVGREIGEIRRKVLAGIETDSDTLADAYQRLFEAEGRTARDALVFVTYILPALIHLKERGVDNMQLQAISELACRAIETLEDLTGSRVSDFLGEGRSERRN